MKTARLDGESYISNTRKIILVKVAATSCNYKEICLLQTSQEDKQKIFENAYSMNLKDQ